MKVIRLRKPGGLDRLETMDLPDPGDPGPGQIRVRLHGSSLNFHDLLVVQGHIPTPDGRIPMADGAGVVERVGEGVTEFTPGDHVVSTFFTRWLDGPAIALGAESPPGDAIDGYAREVAVVDASLFTRAPRGWTHAEAATLTTAGLTAWRALVVDGGLKPGATVLVMGTGGVSIFALQMAKALGAKVIATSSSDEKLERARQLGADHLINYAREPEWHKPVLEMTGGLGADHVIEVGGPATLPESIKAARVGGHIAQIGILTGRAGPVSITELMVRQVRLQGVVVGSRRHQQEMVEALDALDLRPIIDKSFALDDIAAAFRVQAAGGHFGKIVLEF